MKNILEQLEPNAVFKHFENICRIPHGSYNTNKLADYCIEVAEKNHLASIKDGAGNVIISLPASSGHETAAPVILQGHLDMVCEKNESSDHNFEKDPLSLNIDGDYIFADQTTLGGDDGIAIAMCLALIEDPSIIHPKTYCVFTTEEEVGMDGAYALDLTPFSDAYQMINLDSEEEGTATVGCAGGARVSCSYHLHRRNARGTIAKVTISGLGGGHSGEEIDKFGYNANILLGKVLSSISSKIDYGIISLTGGNKDNAIPQTAEAEILIGATDRELLDTEISNLESMFKNMAAPIDKDMYFSVQYGENKQVEILGPDSQKLVLFVLNVVPNGVQTMNRSDENVVDTSLNLGILKTERSTLTTLFNIRSTNDNARDLLCDQLSSFANYLGGTASTTGQYPAWQKRKNSPLYDTMAKVYHSLFDKKLKRVTTHGGLECSLFANRRPDLDIVAIGPNVFDIHTPNERLSISSTQRTWKFLKAILNALS